MPPPLSNSMRQWTKEETRLLISRLEALPELWDASGDLYKNRTRKSNAVAELATAFNTDHKEVTRKLHNCIWRQRKGIIGYNHVGNVHISSWKWFGAW